MGCGREKGEAAAHPIRAGGLLGFGDFVFGQGFDNVSSTIKIRQAGFQECLDSEAMFAGLFERLRKMRLLPTTMFGT